MNMQFEWLQGQRSFICFIYSIAHPTFAATRHVRLNLSKSCKSLVRTSLCRDLGSQSTYANTFRNLEPTDPNYVHLFFFSRSTSDRLLCCEGTFWDFLSVICSTLEVCGYTAVYILKHYHYYTMCINVYDSICN